jgi:predicted nuclease with TOPRIM domain
VTNEQLAARVQELERENEALRKRVKIAEPMARELADSVRTWGDKVSQLVDENAELRAKLDAVPLEAIDKLLEGFEHEGWAMQYDDPHQIVCDWLDVVQGVGEPDGNADDYSGIIIPDDDEVQP